MVMIRDFAPNLDTISQRFGQRLGRGAYRTAFAFGKERVVKYERTARSNNDEWAIWCVVKDTELAQYLCPMLSRSADGCTVIQEKVAYTVEQYEAKWNKRLNADYYGETKLSRSARERLFSERDEFRTRLQDFTRRVSRAFSDVGIVATDMHEGNVGIMRDGRFVILDYGNFYARRGTLQEMAGIEVSDNGSDSSYRCNCEACANEREY